MIEDDNYKQWEKQLSWVIIILFIKKNNIIYHILFSFSLKFSESSVTSDLFDNSLTIPYLLNSQCCFYVGLIVNI